ncbi:uroporphyrinogen-III C-methyltransferase [Carboxylicivirga marina]|uniref:uroporphyrinogen-III C-methyltransferase n=1 Tax=Carboxylicivirga marina TaxID=2800988 RepID=A0ABS1HK76_9BACT|nr:uroporphyrinogen-III C-methyltransferase [Carboxylicivirga marina]MBK3518079.1 uroporphyrinogen-III C-methyltransferase [Carboxylicivirga marina]
MNTNYGKVWLVGAGPGDPELITMKAANLLKKADVILYDYLVNTDLLDYCQPHCQMVYVGKKKDKHTFPQNELNEMLVHYAEDNQCIVRLKGGDPFVFGRGVEEIMTLIEHDIDYEVVPGITSGVAVPAYMGIPVTARHTASSVTFVTGHPAKNGKNAVDWQSLAKASDTLVVYMGISNAAHIASELQQGGKGSDTPVAVIRWGTYAQQSMLKSTLNTIGADMQEAGFKPPALMVIGEVVNYASKLKPVIQTVTKQELSHV